MEAIVNNLIKALSLSIFHSLWQSAVIYLLLFLVFASLPKLSAKLKHNLAFASLTIMFLSFCYTFYSVFEVPLTNNERKIIESFVTQASFHEMDFMTKNSWLQTEKWSPIVTGLYIFGIGIQLLFLVLGYHRLQLLKKSTKISVPTEWNLLFNAVLSDLKFKKKIKFYLSSNVNVPLVIGYLKPVILFPISFSTQLDLQQVEAILIHELSHVTRNDYLLNLIKTIIETLLFFNPFVWLTSKFIRIEREHACDDLVVKHTGSPLVYAKALLQLELLKDKQAPALSLAATGDNQHLYQRIKRITNMKTNYTNAKQQLVILALALSTILSVAWMNPKKAKLTIAKDISTISVNPKEAKEITHIIKSDTDTVKKKKTNKFKYTITDDNGNVRIYNSINEVPDSLRKIIVKQQKFGDSIAAIYSSKEWKDRMAKIEKNALDIQKKYESKEWKNQIAQIEKNALEVAKKYESKEWKDQMAQIEKNALDIQKKYDSKEWKDHVKKIEKDALEISKRFETKEWKDQIEKIEQNAMEMAKKYESKEWKDHIAQIEKNALEISKRFESKEWKDGITKMQLDAERMEKKYNSPEWKQKVEEMKKLQDSPEYKDLKNKFDKDLNDLKKKKGIDK